MHEILRHKDWQITRVFSNRRGALSGVRRLGLIVGHRKLAARFVRQREGVSDNGRQLGTAYITAFFKIYFMYWQFSGKMRTLLQIFDTNVVSGFRPNCSVRKVDRVVTFLFLVGVILRNVLLDIGLIIATLVVSREAGNNVAKLGSVSMVAKDLIEHAVLCTSTDVLRPMESGVLGISPPRSPRMELYHILFIRQGMTVFPTC